VTIRATAGTHGSSHFDTMVIETAFDDCDGVALAGELLSSGEVTRVVFYTEVSDPEIVRDARRVGPVVDKESGPLLLLAALEAASSPVSHFPGPEHAPSMHAPTAGKRH
jgi:hypothetical protein